MSKSKPGTVRAKPETVKAARARCLVFYAPSEKTAKEWKENAKAHRLVFSKWVVQIIQAYLRDEDKAEEYNEIVKERNSLREQLAELSKDVNRYKMLVDRLEAELRDLRAQPFLDQNFTGTRAFPKNLIALLKAGKVRYEDLHARLGIEPGSDASRALQIQMNTLEQYGLIKLSDRFIKWVEVKEE